MIKKFFIKKKNFEILFVILIFLIDRLSKIFVINLDKKYIGQNLFSTSNLNIKLIWNEGIAFGLFSLEKGILYNLLSVFILIVVLIIFFMIKKNDGLKKYALIMIAGGALGNLFDRFYYSSVPDFIDLYLNSFHWFIFNVADIFISIGVLLLIILEVLANNEIKKS